MKRFAVAIVLLAAIASENLAVADELIKQGPVSRAADAMNPTHWRMPQWKMPSFKGLMPAKEKKVRVEKKKEASLFDEVAQTTSKGWQRTKAAFSPKTMNPTKFFQASSKTKTSTKKSSKPGFFRSLFGPKSPPKNHDTVGDFLSQPKPNR